MPTGPEITSTHNPQVKLARSLATRKGRYRERAFVVEGVRLFEDALRAGFRPTRVFFDAERVRTQSVGTTLETLATAGSVVHAVTPAIIDAITDTETPQGIAAIFPFPDVPIALDRKPALYLVADGLKDPGNLGTLLRAAAAAGAGAFFTTQTSVDPYSPKVVRAAMGAHFRLPLRSLRWDSPDPLLAECVQRLGAEAGQGVPYDELDWRLPTLLVLGSEATGLSKEATKELTGYTSIPMHSDVESLNAAIAGAVLLFEAARQRRTQ